MHPVARFFEQDSPLSKAIKGFSPRESQRKMAAAIGDAIVNKKQVVIEAGTGTGKTFAYLVPAIESGKKVILSTGTKALQEQLFHRDLPLIRDALGKPIDIALLKGRANYLCSYRLEQHLFQQSEIRDPVLIDELVRVKRWSNETEDGDIGELADIAEDSRALPYVTSTVDNCLGKDCPDFAKCYLTKARKKAKDADLVVVNHHLFLADMVLKDVGFGELIPDAQLVVFDEAHQLPDIAASYFGENVSTRQLSDLSKDLRRVYLTELKDTKQLGKAADMLEKAAADFRLLFGADPERGNWRNKSQEQAIQVGIERLNDAIGFGYDVMKLAIGRSKELDVLFERGASYKSAMKKVCDVGALGFSYWYETTKRHVALHITPLNVAERFSQHMDDLTASWVFTSATLQVGEKFDHFCDQLGLKDANTLFLPSPFDYESQSLLYVPRKLAEPGPRLAASDLLAAALPLIKASGGRCFFLFTSYRMMNQIAELLPDQIDHPVFVQGTAPKRLLLDQFVKAGDAVLLATASFWEGVDVRGDTLSCVIIDKLPFAAPDEPLLQARIEDCRLRGGDPFAEVQIPQAVLTLKQGAGRLIRDVKDQGVLMICDGRLVSRRYGQIFLSSLPPMPRTRTEGRATEFLASLTTDKAETTE
ncbi:ATP-dependent DNA helicase [Corallincola platygyrae]|uniref:DNA 5'-3' helicase n=2 Tax=Corallincola platygyrae TaxID=1193278 RepID=A0ABW4XT96_9GAMM